MGYRYVETDVHASRDGIVFAFHDGSLDRVSDRTGRLRALDGAAIERADAGYTFTRDNGATFPFRGKGIRVPRLAELLERWPALRINIDPKSDDCVGPLVALLHRLDAWDRVCIGSFSDRRLTRVRSLGRGRACTSMGPRAVTMARFASARRIMPRQGADCLQVPVRWCGIRVVGRRFLDAAHAAGMPVHVWTIDDEPEMRRVADLGVDGIMSDRPGLLRGVLESRGQWTGSDGSWGG